MSVVHFKTVMSEVIGTKIQMFFFWQELFALPSFFFFLLVNDGRNTFSAVFLRPI